MPYEHELIDLTIALLAATPIAIFVVAGIWWLGESGSGRTDRRDS